jgi:hypothetical protein
MGGMWHLLDVITEILNVLVVIVLQVLLSFVCPSSIGFWLDQR